MRLNPAGRIPVLADGDFVMFETAAIVLHLVDTHEDAGLAPKVGTKARARFYQWLMYLTNTVQAEMHSFFYPERHTADAAGIASVKDNAEARLGEMFGLLDRELEARGPFLLGASYSALDPYLAMLVRWGRFFKEPPRNRARVGRLATIVGDRPAFRRAIEQEGLAAPYFG